MPHKIPIYKMADWGQLKQIMVDYYQDLLTRDPYAQDVQPLWDSFIEFIENAIKKCIPVRNAKAKDGHPWINGEIRHRFRKRDRLYRKYRKSGNPKLHSRFLKLKHAICRKSKQAYEHYLLDILGLNDPSDPSNTSPTLKACIKKLFSLLKHSKQDSSGVSALKKDGVTHNDNKECSDTFNDQFHSVFSPKSPLSLGSLCKMKLQDLLDAGHSLLFTGSPHSPMQDIEISDKGIDKLLLKLSPYKASGPDQIKPIVLKTLHAELAPILQIIFQRFLETGKLPSIWKQASVTPIFKKGEKLKPSNYRPISLTCSLCKTLEHIVASSIVKRFDQQHIFFELQHGFREKRSCETQLIMLVDELLKGMLLFGLRFYGPVNPVGSCRARSVYLTTHLLGRLSPLSG